MAERRMFSKRFVNRDAFLEMELSAQALYFHLSLEADDDGFVGSPKGIMRKIGASADDLKALQDGRFIIMFESGVLVISHWKLHNQIKQDRYHSTEYQTELKMLSIDDNKTYHEGMEPEWNQHGTNMEPQSMLDHVRKEKVSQGQAMLSHVNPEGDGAGTGLDDDNTFKDSSSGMKSIVKMIVGQMNKAGFVYTGHGAGGLEGLILSKLKEGHKTGDILNAFNETMNSIKRGNDIQDQTAYFLQVLEDQ